MVSIPTPDSPRCSLLVTNHLTVHYGVRPAITDISVAFQGGQITSVLGPNGAGKSTLLKVLAGMHPASHGSVVFNESPLASIHPEVTYVPQRSGADWSFPITVLQATTLGQSRTRSRWRRLSSSDVALALEALDNVGIANLANVQIGSLSGGQQQRVFLARALLSDGRVLLLDEPFAGVDVPTQELFVTLFDNLRKRGVAVVYATHDLGQAMRTSDRVILINREIIAQGPPRDVMTEANLNSTFGGEVVVVVRNEIVRDTAPTKPS